MGSTAFVNQKQGGGDKKAGFPYVIGRTAWSSVHMNVCDPVNKSCCTLNTYILGFKRPTSSISKNIGSTYTPNTYFSIPGTK